MKFVDSFIYTNGNKEYLIAEEDHGPIGNDDGIFAFREKGEDKWRPINYFKDRPKQSVAPMLVFGLNKSYEIYNDKNREVKVSKEDFDKIIKEL